MTPVRRDGQLLEVGRILRAHGLKGEVVVDFSSDRVERRSPGAVLRTTRGDLVVASAHAFQLRWRVRFEGIDDRNAAERLRGLVLQAEPLQESGDRLWVHELIGAEVADADGRILGRIDAIEANPAADLIVLDGGALIPVVFVVSSSPGRVNVEIPAGLLEINARTDETLHEAPHDSPDDAPDDAATS